LSLWSDANRKIGKWRALPASERCTLAQLVCLLLLSWAGLRLLGTKRMLGIAQPEVSIARNQQNIKIQATGYTQRCAELTAIAAHHCLPRGSCFPQSLALCWLLRKKGLEAQIRIGIKPHSAPLLAHAWVEYQAMVLGNQESEYSAFPDLLKQY